MSQRPLAAQERSRPCADACGFWSGLHGCLREGGCLAYGKCKGCGAPGAIYDGLCPRCDAAAPWDDSDEDDDCCDHGVGFDEDCEDCEAEADE